MPLPLAYTTGQAGHLADMAEIAAQLARLNLTLNVLSYGAVGDLKQAVGGMTSGSAVLTATTSVFSPSDVGKKVWVRGAAAAPSGYDVHPALGATITAYTSGTQVTLSASAGYTATGTVIYWWTDDTAAVQAAIDAASALASTTKGKVKVLVPAGYRFGLTVTANQIRNVIPDGGQLDSKYALRMKTGVHLVIDGELCFPFVGVAASGNWVNAIMTSPADTGWRISGAGKLNGLAPDTDSVEWIHQGIQVCGSSYWQVVALEVSGFHGDGIRADGGGTSASPTWPSVFEIHNNHITLCVGQGIELNGAINGSVIGNNLEENRNFAAGGGAEAIWLGGVQQVVVEGNTVRRWGTAVTLNQNCINVTVANNAFEEEISYYAGTMTDVRIVGNHCWRVRISGTGTETRMTIVGNTINTPDASASISAGGTGGTGLVVANNVCNNSIGINAGVGAIVDGNSAAGMTVAASASVVSNNKLFLSQLQIFGADCVVTGNIVNATAAGANGLDLAGARCLISGNYLKTTASGQHGVYGIPGYTVDDSFIVDNVLSAPAQAINMNGPASKARLEQYDNKILSGTIVGVTTPSRFSGTGSPESVVAAYVGSTYLRSDGGAGTTFYVKESGAGTNTGWVAK